MENTDKPRTFAAILLGGALSAGATPALAADTVFLELLKTLKDSGTISPQAYDQLTKSAKTDAEKNAKAQAQAAQVAAQANSPVPKVTVGPGLKVESADGAFSFKIGGKLNIDGGFADEAPAGSGGMVDMRRAQLIAEGKAWRWWDYKLQYDFANGSAGSAAASSTPVGSKAGFFDAYLALRYFDPVYLQVGHFYEPMGLERMTSANYVTFMERALVSETLIPNRHVGFAARTGGADWTAKAGVFSTSFQDKALAPVTGGNQYWDLTGRITYAPVHTSDTLLHLGIAMRYEEPNDSTAGSNDRVLAPGTNVKSEANVLGMNLIGTPALDCGAASINRNCVNDVVDYGFEIAASHGPLFMQGEWVGSHYDRNSTLVAAANTANRTRYGSNLDFQGYYAYASWFLTGESRAATYQINKYPEATFGQIPIAHPLSDGGVGAWEVAARYSGLDLNDNGVKGGREQNFTLGLNWYPDPGFRLMADWVSVVDLAAPSSRPNLNGKRPNMFLMRAQVDW